MSYHNSTPNEKRDAAVRVLELLAQQAADKMIGEPSDLLRDLLTKFNAPFKCNVVGRKSGPYGTAAALELL